MTVGAHYLTLLHLNEDPRHGYCLCTIGSNVKRLVIIDMVELKNQWVTHTAVQAAPACLIPTDSMGSEVKPSGDVCT